jgi:hypothetical protein
VNCLMVPNVKTQSATGIVNFFDAGASARFDLRRGISLVGQVCGCERFNMSQQIPSRDLNV